MRYLYFYITYQEERRWDDLQQLLETVSSLKIKYLCFSSKVTKCQSTPILSQSTRLSKDKIINRYEPSETFYSPQVLVSSGWLYHQISKWQLRLGLKVRFVF